MHDEGIVRDRLVLEASRLPVKRDSTDRRQPYDVYG